MSSEDLFIATVVDLAARKWISLVEDKSGWTMKWEGQGTTPLEAFEEDLLGKIFEGEPYVTTNELAHRSKNDTAVLAGFLEGNATAELKRQNIISGFRWDGKATAVFGISALISCLIFWVLESLAPEGFGTGVVVVGAGLSSLGFATRTTSLGEAFRWRVVGFQELFEHSENYHAQLAASANIFRQYMGYAVLFGAVDRWAQAFPKSVRSEPEFNKAHVMGFTKDMVGAFETNRSIRTPSGGGFSSSGFSGGSFSGGSSSGGASSGGGGRW